MAEDLTADDKIIQPRAQSAEAGKAAADPAGDSRSAVAAAPTAVAPVAKKPAAKAPVAATAAAAGDNPPLVKRGRGRPPKSAAEKAATIALRKRRRQSQAAAARKPALRTTPARATAKSRPISKPATAAPVFPKIERNPTVNFDSNNIFAGFGSIPGPERFQTIFADATAKSQEAMSKSSKLAEEMVDLTKANVEALVSSSRIAAAGAQALGQEAVAYGKQGLEQASAAVKGFAEAKSPTELLQLQSDYARAAFDRMVSNSSKIAESLVKFAGEAFEPLSTRASVNAERFNSIVA